MQYLFQKLSRHKRVATLLLGSFVLFVFVCYVTVEHHIRGYRPDIEIQKLRAHVEQEPADMIHCHMEAHMIGHHAYAHLGKRALTYADPLCGGGYLHGVIEEAFRQNGMDFLSQSTHDMCTDENMESCLHGVGHGLHQLLRDIGASVDACNQIDTTHTDCYDGVFMDAFDTEGGVKGEGISLSRARDICTSAAQIEQPSCYFYLPRAIPEADVHGIVDLCVSVAEGDNRDACGMGSGVYFMKYVSGFQEARSLEFCDSYEDTRMTLLCREGVANYARYGSASNTKWH